MIPGKGRDTVRKNGDYKVLQDNRSWRNWITNPHDCWEEARDHEICEEIYGYLEPLF
jgi:hypothetical protein